MPIETLQPDRMVRQISVATTFTSAMPFRILNKGPEYFRKQIEPLSKKPSAVERLEADKAKYVKSQKVASTKQEPVKPPLKKQPLSLVRRDIHTPIRKTPFVVHKKEPLNLEILNNLINVSDSPVSSPKSETSPGVEARLRSEPLDSAFQRNLVLPRSPFLSKHYDSVDGKTKFSENLLMPKPPSAVAVRRVDVRPSCIRMVQTLPATPPPLSPAASRLSSVSAKSSPKTHMLEVSQDSTKSHPSLHRSKSDLSDRYSRATADLERFFNYCGLDPEEIENIGMDRFARASSDIVSLKFHSVSTASSADGRSHQSHMTEERHSDRVPYGISVVERNARVIKWLYGLRQAMESQKISSV